jgi:outer membrane protein assembly factor BamB
VYALDAATGANQWMSPEKMSSDPVVAGGLLYFGTFDGYVCALDVTTGVVKWFYWDGGTVGSGPAVADGMLYYGSMLGRLYAFHLRGT